MKKWQRPELVITGLGITSAVGQGKTAYLDALMNGRHRFGVMSREGRQRDTEFLGAELPPLIVSDSFSKKALRTASLAGLAALITVDEAWQEARLDGADRNRIGLIVGGSNFQQRELTLLHDRHAAKPAFVRPTYAVNFMDTDVCGLCTEQFGILGATYTVGAASASGQMAIIQAAQAVQSGAVDICIAVGALMDLSYWECLAFRGIGAMGSDQYAQQPENACRPFDKQRDGFIYGESCAAVVIERADNIARTDVKPYAKISGWGMACDGNRNPDPSLDGEIRVIEQALQRAGLQSGAIDYVNPHGTASLLGDQIELQAIRHCGLNRAKINTTKSIVGHGLTAAGAVELVSTVLQMDRARLHPCRNLEDPIESDFQWVGEKAEDFAVHNALNLSFGFGGINTAVCVSKWPS